MDFVGHRIPPIYISVYLIAQIRTWIWNFRFRYEVMRVNMFLLITVRFDLHEWRKEISLVLCFKRTLTASRWCSLSTYKLNAQWTHSKLTSYLHQLLEARANPPKQDLQHFWHCNSISHVRYHIPNEIL